MAFYCHFNGTVTSDPVTFSPNTASFNASGKYGQGLNTSGSELATTTSTGINARRGTVTFWLRMDTPGYIDSLISVYPGPPYVNITPTTGSGLTIAFDWGGTNSGSLRFENAADQLADNFAMTTGVWYHYIWSWQGMSHTLYRNGAVVSTLLALSPMPAIIGNSLRIIWGGGGSATATIDELGFYDFCFNATDVAAAYAATNSLAITPSGAHGMRVDPQWAPGNGQVLISADAGTDHAATADHYDVVVKRGVTTVATATISGLAGGYGHKLINVTTPFVLDSNYTAEVTLKNASNATLATVTTATFNVPASATWLGNNYGKAAAGTVQPPWTAISQSPANVLNVWGRSYTLAGGWGLPQQIRSQNENLLSEPIKLLFDVGSGEFQLNLNSFSITSVANDVAIWTGSASANGVSAAISGRLEYDGMVLLTLSLTATGSPLTVNTIKMQMIMPAARALWFSHGSFYHFGQVAAYDCKVPASVGMFKGNTYSTNGNVETRGTQLWPSVTLCDDDRGLEWFCDSFRGWSINYGATSGTVTQSLNVLSGSRVMLECNFATIAFTLGSTPCEIVFGFEAVPMKPLNTDWRASQIANPGGGGPNIPGMYALFWSYPDDAYRGQPTACWRAYALTPGSFSDNIATDTATVHARGVAMRANGIDISPYTQMHTIIGAGLNPPVDSTTVLAFLAQEMNQGNQDGEVGYISTLSTGAADFWLDAMEWNYDQGIAEGVYIDEAYYAYSLGTDLIGAGWTDSNLISRPGFNSLKIRDWLKRQRQQMLDHSLKPTVWIDESTAHVAPHMWAFVDYASDGEGLFGSGTNDFITTYNTTKNMNWLRGLSRTQKFGWRQVFLNNALNGSTTPYYRAMHGLLQMHDINLQDTYHSQWTDYMQPRADFGMMTRDDITFKGFWANNEIVPDGTVICSYYRRDNDVLACFLNMTGSSYTGTITINSAALGLTFSSAKDAQTLVSIPLSGQTFNITLASHDYKDVLLLGEGNGGLDFVEDIAMTYQSVHYWQRVDIRTDVPVPVPAEAPPDPMVLLLHGDGADASTSITDSSSAGHTVTVNGNTQIDTAQSKFGGASILFDGTGDNLTLDGGDDFTFGTGDCTIDFWIRHAALGFMSYIDFRTSSGSETRPMIYVFSNTVRVYVGGGDVINTTTSLATDTWYHIALTRSGNNLRLFINGVQEGGTVSHSDDWLPVAASRPTIGDASAGGSAFNGWIDELRIVKGEAMWTANFTPPSTPY